MDVRYLKVGKGWTSPTSCILVKKDNGARSIVWSPGSAPELSGGRRCNDDQVGEDTARQRTALGGLHGGGQNRAVQRACRYRSMAAQAVIVPELDQLVPLTDICIVARDFAEKYTRERDMGKAAEMLLRSGPGLVVITEGTKGSWVYPRRRAIFSSAGVLASRCGGYNGLRRQLSWGVPLRPA